MAGRGWCSSNGPQYGAYMSCPPACSSNLAGLQAPRHIRWQAHFSGALAAEKDDDVSALILSPKD